MRAKIFFVLLLFPAVLIGCGQRKTESSTPEALSVAQAMATFYGNYDPVKQASTVSFSESDRVRISGEPMIVRPLFHTFSGQGSIPNFVLVTYAVPQSDEKYYCHACAPTIGMAVFSQQETNWTVAAANRAVTDAGEFGKPPSDIGLVQIGPFHQGVKIIDVDDGNGETTAVLLILVPWEHTVNLALERVIADDDIGMCGDLPCYANHRMVNFLRDGKADYFDLELGLTGTDLPLSEGKGRMRARAVLGVETLKFVSGKYQQISRKGDLTYLDKDVADREGLK